MMTQGVMTQAVNLFGNTTGSVTLKGKQSNSSFDLMIDSTMKSGSGIADNSNSAEVKKVSNQSNVNGNQQQSDAVDGSTKQTDDTNKVSVKTENIKTAQQADNQTQKAEDTKQTEDPNINEATLEKIAGMLQALQQSVMELLDLTSEELDKLLTEQGFSLVDLLQPENLQQLVLADSGATSILTVLTDEKLSETMNQLLKAVGDIVEDANLGMSPEQIKSILDQAKLQQDGSQVTSKDNTTGEEGIKNQESNQEAAINNQDVGQKEKNTMTTQGDDKNIQVEVIKVTDTAESSSGTQAELSKNDNREMTSTEQFEVFLNNLSNASTSSQVDFNGNMVQVTEIREIANQIIERIRVTIRPEQSSMELQLNPEHLGKVNLSVQSKNGVMTAQFVVQNEISKEAIESQLHTLKETLNQQGIKVEAIEVTVATYSFEQNSQDKADGQSEAKKGNGNHNRISLDEAISMTEDIEDITSQDITDIRGGQIDYTA